MADPEAAARECEAFERRGKAADTMSLRATAAAACGTVATLSDKAVEGRPRKSGDWLEHLLQSLLRARAIASGRAGPDRRLGIKPPGSGGQFTSLSADDVPPARVIEMHRARWRVELSFKRLKTLGGIDRLPSAGPRSARTWLLAFFDCGGFEPCAGSPDHRLPLSRTTPRGL